MKRRRSGCRNNVVIYRTFFYRFNSFHFRFEHVERQENHGVAERINVNVEIAILVQYVRNKSLHVFLTVVHLGKKGKLTQ